MSAGSSSNFNGSNLNSLFPQSNYVISPSIDILEEVVDRLYSDSTFSENFDSLVIKYGTPRMNFATIDAKDSMTYILTLPLVKNGKITSFIFYDAHGDHFHFRFSSLANAFYFLNESPESVIMNSTELLSLIKYQSYLYTRYGQSSPSLESWLMDYVAANDISVQTRTEKFEIGFTAGIFGNGYATVTYVTLEVTSACPSSSSGGDGGWSGWSDGSSNGEGPSGSGTGSDGNDDESEVGDETDIESDPIDPFELDDDCMSFSVNEEVRQLLENYANNAEFCGSRDAEEVIGDILDQLCDSTISDQSLGGGFGIQNADLNDHIITAENFYESLESVGDDNIVIPTQLKDNCPKVACVVEKMLGGEDPFAFSSDLFCEILAAFEPNDGVAQNLIISAGSYSSSSAGMNQNAIAGTELIFRPSIATMIITFNSDKCESLSGFETFEALSHELLHADIKRRLVVDHGLSSLNEDSYGDAIRKLLEAECGNDGVNDPPWTNDHELMFNEYLYILAENLWSANNEIGDISDYVGTVLNGFPMDIILASDDYNTEAEVFSEINSSHEFLEEEGNLLDAFEDCD